MVIGLISDEKWCGILLRTIVPPAQSRLGREAQIFTARDPFIPHTSVSLAVWDNVVPKKKQKRMKEKKYRALLPFQHHFFLPSKKERQKDGSGTAGKSPLWYWEGPQSKLMFPSLASLELPVPQCWKWCFAFLKNQRRDEREWEGGVFFVVVVVILVFNATLDGPIVLLGIMHC